MKYYYSLRIESFEDNAQKIDEILGVSHNMVNENWGIEIIVDENDKSFNFIDYFLGILNNNYEKLAFLGVHRKDISIWMLYEYDDQCNMEFSPAQLLKIGSEGITLCISCWER